MEKVVTNLNIAEILAAGKPVVIDFWAEWCGPCRMLGPTVSDVAEKMGDKAIVAKCNVDDCEEIASTYGIRNIPTLLYFKDGELAGRSVGIVSGQEIISKLESLA